MTEKRIRMRTVFLGGAFTFLFFLLLLRVFWIQTVNAQWLLEKAQLQWERNDTLQPKRGTIFDRNGELLAYTSKAYTVIAKLRPLSKKDEDYVDRAFEAAQKLAPILGMSTDRITKLIEDGKAAKRGQVELRPGGWKIDEDKAEEIAKLAIPGIILYPETKRYYPNDAFAAHVLGYTDLDDKAVMGIEKVFDERLQGTDGKLRVLKDQRGFKLPAAGSEDDFIPARDGDNIYLTIDYQIQNYVEDALNNITKKYKANGISVIVADPHSGEILAMANRPHFSPNKYQDITNWTNFAISNTFEPGSTFKIVTLAAAIEEGAYRNDLTYMSGTYRRDALGPPIRDHNQGKGWGTISYLRGVQESSNVLFTILGYENLGKDKLYEYLQKFGFGQQTGIGLPGEASAELRDKERLYPRDVASMTFGQGVVVTAIQQVAAVSAVANGGELVKPYVVKEIRDAQTGEVIERTERTVKRRVISEETAKQTRDILESVVDEGTGSFYRIEGYHVAGKTGTAQVVGANGRYLANKHIYSFIGFAPKDDPKFVVYVMVDQPNVSNFGGRDIVAPIFKHIMENSLQYKKVSPDLEAETIDVEETDAIAIPDLSGKTPVIAEEMLKQVKLRLKVVGTGSKIVGQYPRPGEEVIAGSVLYVITDKVDEDYLPDFTGQTLREVMEYSSMMGLSLDVHGKGYVVSQNIEEGTRVKRGGQLAVELKPRSNQLEDERITEEEEQQETELEESDEAEEEVSGDVDNQER
ncbi:hypothetical protein BEP19_06710 [Ammoniphilus oxalaticus]|uniref:PASTA domain-containing protein n=1 Tax=Ammoniphilus oxalaticus TaxID=66863 RepID=A0A419SJ77_9BACL|nr:PASTA domain-containing penicillin-binding protein [Ammoniphilus oxalaticus]RKD24094.1 hypothetical protein BEP19_06710 [Ammoniphilus oxalaticus]